MLPFQPQKHTNQHRHIRAHTHVYIHIYIHTYTQTHIHTDTDTHTHVHSHTRANRRAQTSIHEYAWYIKPWAGHWRSTEAMHGRLVLASVLVVLLPAACTTTPPAHKDDADETLPWHKITQQQCNVGMQSAYRKSFFRPMSLAVTCGIYNEDKDMDFTGKPCCCSFCGQRDPFGQLCEITKHVCTTVADCIQTRHGECMEEAAGGGIDTTHVMWVLIVSGITVAPFIVPVWALGAAEDIVMGLAG
jgi:hypothetical protein